MWQDAVTVMLAAVTVVAAVRLNTTSPQQPSTASQDGHHGTTSKEGKEEEASQEVVLWRGGVVPYAFGKSITASQRSVILQAMGDFHNKTCIRFTKRRNETDYIKLHSAKPGCSSSVGRAGGRQTMNLNGRQCMVVGTVIHELMHIIGLFHEHAREDRADYVTVNMQNIIPDMWPDFKIVPGRTLGIRYNYESIMHYGPYAFSKKRGAKTIVPTDPKADIKDPWRRTEMADTDVLYIHKLYKDECQLDMAL